MRLALACCGIVFALFGAPAWAHVDRQESAATIRVDVAEWNVVPSVGVVPAGRVRIEVHNIGQVAHQLVLVRTDSFDPRLRLRGDRALVPSPVRSVVIRPGATSSFAISLRRGSYLLLDNLPLHYWKGTSVAFSVR